MDKFDEVLLETPRVREDLGKLYFTIFDFRDVTRLFHDPDFDGPIEQQDDFQPHKPGPGPDEPPKIPQQSDEKKKKYMLGDTSVSVSQKHVQYLDKNGNLITESLIDYTKRNVRNQYASMNNFLQAWNDAERKQTIIEELEKRGIFFDDLCDEVGIYLGDGQFIHASQRDGEVVISPMEDGYYSEKLSWGIRPLR